MSSTSTYSPISKTPSLPLRDGTPGIPAIGFGTWRCDVEKLESAVYHALRVGYRHIDAANLYRNEHLTGAAIKQALEEKIVSREDLFIVSKVAPTQMDPDLVLPTIKKSIEDLQVGYLDLYITHWPYAIDPNNTISPAPVEARFGYDSDRYLAVWREMEKGVDLGLVKYLGCSNMSAKKLHTLMYGSPDAIALTPGVPVTLTSDDGTIGAGAAATSSSNTNGTSSSSSARIFPAVVQVEMHPCLAQPSLVEYARRHKIVLTGYCPLGSPGRPAIYIAPGDPDILTHPTVLDIAGKNAPHTPAQVVLRWAFQRGTVPLPRSVTHSRIEENFASLSIALDSSSSSSSAGAAWTLSDEDMKALDSLDATKNSIGRIMKGDNFMTEKGEGNDWHNVWDEDWIERRE